MSSETNPMRRKATKKKASKRTNHDASDVKSQISTEIHKRLFNDNFDFGVIDEDARTNLNFSHTYDIRVIPKESSFATVVLDNDVVSRIAAQWVSSISGCIELESYVNESLQCLAHALCELHFAMQIFVSSCPGYLTNMGGLFYLIDYKYKLPQTTMTLLNSLGNFDTKVGSVKIEYVEATIYTAFMRAKALFEHSELIRSKRANNKHLYEEVVLNSNF